VISTDLFFDASRFFEKRDSVTDYWS